MQSPSRYVSSLCVKERHFFFLNLKYTSCPENKMLLEVNQKPTQVNQMPWEPTHSSSASAAVIIYAAGDPVEGSFQVKRLICSVLILQPLAFTEEEILRWKSNQKVPYDGIPPLYPTPCHLPGANHWCYAPAAKGNLMFSVSFLLQYRIKYMAWKLAFTHSWCSR